MLPPLGEGLPLRDVGARAPHQAARAAGNNTLQAYQLSIWEVFYILMIPSENLIIDASPS